MNFIIFVCFRSIQVDRQLNWLYKLDISGDGHKELILCCWDGHTYIVNKDQKSVRFQFDESVCTFTAGLYAINGADTKCFVYVTFNNKIYVYYNIELDEISTVNTNAKLGQVYREKFPNITDAQVSQLTKYLLYGPQKTNK